MTIVALTAALAFLSVTFVVALMWRAPLDGRAERPRLGRHIQHWIAAGLHQTYQDAILDPLPDEWTDKARSIETARPTRVVPRVGPPSQRLPKMTAVALIGLTAAWALLLLYTVVTIVGRTAG
jgi:hypothetical protein